MRTKLHGRWVFKPLSVLIGMMICIPGLALAIDFSFSGNFSSDDDLELFDFSVDVPSNVTLVTKSYAGGTLSDGTVVPAGGFDPVLSLFDSSGLLIEENDDPLSPNVGIDPVTGEAFDAFLELALIEGDYTVAVTQFDNFANGPNLSDGFELTGDPFFTSIDGCSNGQFCDGEFNRTNAWAFDVLNVGQVSNPGDSSTVPEPSTVLLFGSGLAGLLGWRLRRTT